MTTKKLFFYSLVITSFMPLYLSAMETTNEQKTDLVTHDISCQIAGSKGLLTFQGTEEQIKVVKACYKREGSFKNIRPTLEAMTKTINSPVKCWIHSDIDSSKKPQPSPDFRDMTLLEVFLKAVTINLVQDEKLKHMTPTTEELINIFTPYQKKLFTALQKQGAQDNILWAYLGTAVYMEASHMS